MPELNFHAISGAGELSANAFLLEYGQLRVLLDAGARHNRRPDWVDEVDQPDMCWVSHVHWDHLGAVATLARRFPRLRFAATRTTARLAPVALADSGLDAGRAQALASRLEVVPLRRYFDLSVWSDTPGAEKFRVMAFPAGHMPGAAMLLVEVDVGRDRPFRLLYTGDFCGHDQPLVDGALFPRTGSEFPIDVLVMEGVLATRKQLDQVDYGEELARLTGKLAERAAGALIGVSSLGEAAPLTRALVDAGQPPVLHSGLESVLEVCWPDYREHGVQSAGDSQCARALGAGRVVIAPGDQFGASSAAGRALTGIIERDDALVVVVNRAHRNSVARRLISAERGKEVRVGRHRRCLRAEVAHFLLPSHAPRSQLVEAVGAVDPARVLLVHGHRSHLHALARAIDKAGFSGAIQVPDNCAPVALA